MREPPPLILAYHGVADVPLAEDPLRLFVRPADLKAQIRALRAWGYRLTTFGELAEHTRAGTTRGWAALTFDDGFADNLSTLAPLLKELDAPATVFLISSLLGRPHPSAPGARLLTREEVATLAQTGIEIGAHTVTHARLDGLSYEQALDELAGCKAQLEEVKGVQVTSAAYPYGAAGPETAAACREAGFRAACRTSGEGSWSDPFLLPRQAMGNRDTLTGLWLKRHNRHEPLMRPLRPLLRTRAGAYAVRKLGE
jgi:peptidoglycan/xylan/chitin deacetylase (PgdA/CDA1 family)